MKRGILRPACPAFTFVELLVVIAIVGILIFLAIPSFTRRPHSLTGTLNAARQLHLATQMMALDTANTGEGMDWTFLVSKKKKATPASLAEYCRALTDNNYLSEAELRKLFTAPGRGPGGAPITAENIAFRVFQIDEESPSDQPFVVSANWRDRTLTADAPYGKKGFVLFAKDGSGGVYTRKTDPGNAKLFPTGAAYRYDTLR